MQFRLQTLLLVFMVLWSSLALFGVAGIGVFFFVLVVAVILCKMEHPGLLLSLLLLLGIIVAIVVSLPAVRSTREAGRRATCMNNLKQISLAVLRYEAVHRRFPPAYIPDKDGKPMHSWRVLILPYLERPDLYQQYNFDEPWDGPNNRKLLAKRPRIFACPSDDKVGATTTSYVAVVGKNALWRAEKPRSVDELAVHYGTSNTVMLVEVANSGINWTEPRDFCLDEPKAAASASPVPRVCSEHLSSSDFFSQESVTGACIAFADSHVQFLPSAAFASDKLKDWLAVGGFSDEEIDALPPGYGRTINWTNCSALVVWIASVGLLFYRARRSRKVRGPHDAIELKPATK